MAEGYQGPVRIRTSDGVLLTTGAVELEPDAETGGWGGSLRALKGSAVAGKALVVQLETLDGRVGLAQLIPDSEAGEHARSRVAGLGPAPF